MLGTPALLPMSGLQIATQSLLHRHQQNAERLPRIDLLGELNTSADELTELGEAIRTLIAVWGPSLLPVNLSTNFRSRSRIS